MKQIAMLSSVLLAASGIVLMTIGGLMFSTKALAQPPVPEPIGSLIRKTQWELYLCVAKGMYSGCSNWQFAMCEGECRSIGTLNLPCVCHAYMIIDVPNSVALEYGCMCMPIDMPRMLQNN